MSDWNHEQLTEQEVRALAICVAYLWDHARNEEWHQHLQITSIAMAALKRISGSNSFMVYYSDGTQSEL